MQELSRKNKLFTDSVIRRMTRIAIEHNAINLAQGFPDFDPPKALTDRLAEVSAMGPHQYPITMGAPNFREALARKAGRFMGRTLDPNTEMVVTIGSTEAMVDTIFALTNPGDKIIMFSPYFENYHAQAIMAGCESLFIPLVPPEFNFDPEVLEDVFRQPFYCSSNTTQGGLLQYHIDQTWTPGVYESQSALYPRATWDNAVQNYAASNLWEKDAKYLRLKTVSLSYDFINPAFRKIGMTKCEVTLSGYNLLTFTPYKWGDPETIASSAPSYPLQRTYTISLNVGF